VYEIDGLGFVEPVFFCVVDFKAEVWWDPGGVRQVRRERADGIP
jgi:hypothetical protein